ncbi:MAG: transglycosylase [Gammaproteobacteria bacterium]|jgi:hypothetical protein|nr:transglycosylase [Gammaproteobacteria bacterium]|tara:strand:+ start:9041 stop:9637 length:597 start_codon:yes stop_codon:yes gene_type:complete
MKKTLVLLALAVLASCANSIPNNQDDICDILDENPKWVGSLMSAKKKWNADPSTVMAIIRQESSFDSNAAPDREKILGFIPWKRPTTAKGYSQAIEGTWEQYQKETGQNRAKRSSFDNSVDFIGWYLSKASSVKIRNYEVDKLYLAYHEGYGGYKRRSYTEKDWLLDIAKKVKYNAVRYERQIKSCPLKEKKSFWDIF